MSVKTRVVICFGKIKSCLYNEKLLMIVGRWFGKNKFLSKNNSDCNNRYV